MRKGAGDEDSARTPPPPINPPLGDAFNQFIASMTITFDMWHDGLGYDLDALAKVSPAELKTIETILINHHPRDWRDIEALAQIDLPAARETVKAALKNSDAQVRQTAMRYAGKKADPAQRESLLIKSLENDVLFGGLSQATRRNPRLPSARGDRCIVPRRAQP